MIAELIDIPLPYPTGSPRSEGVHVSAIIRSIAAETGILDPKWVEDLSLVEVAGNGERWWNRLDEVSKLRMGMGLAFEDWYLPQIPGVIHQPGEMCIDGIYMTADGQSLDVIATQQGPRHQMAVHEVKTTYKSRNTVGDLSIPPKGVSKSWMWLCQCRAYCKGMGTTRAYLHILYMCGDYSYPISPLRDVWKIEFEQGEIDQSWELLTEHLRAARANEANLDFDGRE